jgi:MOSC domain-containing protein
MLIAPVKGLRVLAREAVELGIGGVRENRRFFLIDSDGQMVNGKRLGSLQAVVAEYSDVQRTLSLRFPDETVVSGSVEPGGRLEARFFSTKIAALEVLGPWSDAFSAHLGQSVRLVESEDESGAVDRGRDGAVSLISRATVERLTRAAGLDGAIDARRFRMLFQIDGTRPHEEDEWLERALRIGGALVKLRGHVGRCLVTKLDPDSGVRDLETLDALASYRSATATTEPLACGVYGTVLEPGTVRVGDAVELV